MNTYTYHISGTHCESCKILIEEILKEQKLVRNSYVDLKNNTIKVETDSNELPERFAEILSEAVRPNGYSISIQKISEKRENDNVFWQALPIGFVLLAIFFLLQKSNILNVGFGGAISPITSFMIGLVASVSSCLAVVGGLVLSLSAKISEDNISDTKTFVLFHSGRIVGFAILGGALGAVGNVIGINFTLTSILGLCASAVMFFLGLNLIGLFKKNRITISPRLFNFFREIEHKTFAPLLLGLATFFLPCGFTQAMQVSALSSGSFISGLLIMLFFALGTLPVLLLLSFGSASLAHGRHSSLFFKSAGVVVIGLGLFSFLSGLAGLGIISPLFNI